MKKIRLNDQLERELASALEGYVREAAVEDFPKELREKVKDRSPRDAKRALHDWAKLFAAHGVAIDDITFDDYKVIGVLLERFPKDSLTVLNHNNDFLIYDSRSTSEKAYYWDGDYRKHTRERDGRWVRISKIPAYQMLKEAKDVWVIPEEDLTTDVKSLKEQRMVNQSGTGEYRRFRTEEERKANSWWAKDLEKVYDKSGYYLDTENLKRNLKKRALEREAKKGGITLVRETLLKQIEFFNSSLREGKDSLDKLLEKGYEAISSNAPTSFNWLNRINSIKSEIRSLENRADRLEKAKEVYPEDETIDYQISDLLKEVKSLFTNSLGSAFIEDLTEFIEEVSLLGV